MISWGIEWSVVPLQGWPVRHCCSDEAVAGAPVLMAPSSLGTRTKGLGFRVKGIGLAVPE